MARDPQLYIIDSDAIQGQAGKPFSHDPGTKLRFPTDNVQVNNRCLCNYRYYQYFAFYQYLPNTSYSNSIQFYFLQPTADGYSLQTDQHGLFTFDTYIGLGYQWRLHSGPVYLGCHPAGTYQTGKWLPISLPYTGLGGGTTQPAPRYVQTNQFHQGSLKCMFVTNYKCCNGVQGCGIAIGGSSQDSQSFENFDLPFFAADFYVTGLMGDQPTASLIKGTQRCEPNGGRLPKTYIRHTCDAATATGWYAFNLISQQQDDRVQQCNEYCSDSGIRNQAAERAIAYARERIKGRQCVYWVLWRFIIPVCYDPCSLQDTQWSIVGAAQEWATVPADVTGKGPGWLFPDEHTTQRIIKCEQHTVYQWASVSMEAYKKAESQFTDPQHQPIGELLLSTMPQPLTQNPCADACGYNKQLAGFGFEDSSTSGSISGSGASDTPCNSPDPYYKVFLDYWHQQFDLYYLKLTKKQLDPALFNTELDPCKEYYTPQTQIGADGKRKLKWHDDGTQLYDYELLQKGRIRGTTFLRWSKDKSKFYLVVPAGQDPPQNQSDSRLKDFHFLSDSIFIQDPNSNKCQGVYQCYYMGCKCPDPCSDSCSESQKVPLITGGCFKWAYIGRISDEQLLQRGICKDSWQQSTQMRTGSNPPIGMAVYTTNSDDPSFCDDYPKPPARILQYIKATFSPGCSEEDSDSIQIQIEQLDIPLCGKLPAVHFGWKKQDSLSSSQTLQFDQQYGYIDVSSDSDTCQLYYFAPQYEGIVLYDQNCNANIDIDPPSYNELFSDAKPSIIWNYPVCRDWVKKYWYNVYQYTPSRERSNSSSVVGPREQSIQYNWDQSESLTFGWVDNEDPQLAQKLLIDIQGNILPRTAGMASDSYLCTIYKLQRTGYYYGCPQFAQKESQSLSPAQLLQLVDSPILWNRHKCFQYYTAFKYIYAVFQLDCQTANLVPVGMKLPPQWKPAEPIRLPDINGIPQPAQSLNWGWLDDNNPLTGAPLLGSGQTVIPTSDIGASSDSYLCYVYYVHKVAEYYGAAQQPDFGSQSLSAPDLSGYSIAWNIPICLDDSYKVGIQYYGAAFKPSCSNSTPYWSINRQILPDNTDLSSLKFGWGRTGNPLSQQSVSTELFTVYTGELCQIFYTQLRRVHYFCGESDAWPAFSDSQPDLSLWNIAWNRCKCLQAGDWYIYKDAIITPMCKPETHGYITYYNELEIGQPQKIQLCLSNATLPNPINGYFIQKNGSPLICDVIDGVPQPRSDSCYIKYRYPVFNGYNCGEPDQSQYSSDAAISYLRTLNIPWPDHCKGYKQFWYYQAIAIVPDCTNMGGKASGTVTSDLIQLQEGQAAPSAGFYYTLPPVSGAAVNTNTTLASCSIYDVHVQRIQACDKSDAKAQVIQHSFGNIYNLPFPASCLNHNYITWYQGTAAPTCSDRAQAEIHWGTQQSAVWEIGSSPPSNVVSLVQAAGNGLTQYIGGDDCSPIWYDRLTMGQKCSGAAVPVLQAPASAYTKRPYTWKESCLIEAGWHWYQNYAVYTYSQNCNSTKNSCSVYCNTGSRQEDVIVRNSWTGSGTCAASYTIPIGEPYLACRSRTQTCPTDTWGYTFPASCSQKLWYQNYVTWQFALDKTNCSVTSTSRTSYVTAQTSAKAHSSVNTAWSSNGCTKTVNILRGSAYSGCTYNPMHGPIIAPSTPTDWPASCLNWYQNYVVYTFSKWCNGSNQLTTSYCSAYCKQGDTAAAVAVISGWKNSGTCSATYTSVIGNAYNACTSTLPSCPAFPTYTFPGSCGGKWYQNYVEWTYTKDSRTCSVISTSMNSYVSGMTAADASSNVNTAWQGTGCTQYKNVLAGGAYYACQYNAAQTIYNSAAAPGAPPWPESCCASTQESIDCNSYTATSEFSGVAEYHLDDDPCGGGNTVWQRWSFAANGAIYSCFWFTQGAPCTYYAGAANPFTVSIVCNSNTGYVSARLYYGTHSLGNWVSRNTKGELSVPFDTGVFHSQQCAGGTGESKQEFNRACTVKVIIS